MSGSLSMPTTEQTLAVLLSALKDRYGAGVRLEDWSWRVLSERQCRRVVRYDLRVRTEGAFVVEPQQWVGKFYDREETARNVAVVLHALASGDCATRGDVILPRVIAYHGPFCLLLLTCEPGEPVLSKLPGHGEAILAAIGRALAALHATPITLERVSPPADILADLRARIIDLCHRLPGESAFLRHALAVLERQAPGPPPVPSLLHGDFGPAQLLWHESRLAILDFDKCTLGDPALDLGNLLAQLRRRALMDPDATPPFDSARVNVLDAYQRWSSPQPGLAERAAWYEQIVLLRKIDFLSRQAAAEQQDQALRLLRLLATQAEGIAGSGPASRNRRPISERPA